MAKNNYINLVLLKGLFVHDPTFYESAHDMLSIFQACSPAKRLTEKVSTEHFIEIFFLLYIFFFYIYDSGVWRLGKMKGLLNTN